MVFYSIQLYRHCLLAWPTSTKYLKKSKPKAVNPTCWRDILCSSKSKKQFSMVIQHPEALQISSSGAKSHLRVAIFLGFFPGDLVGWAGENMLSANFNWSMR